MKARITIATLVAGLVLAAPAAPARAASAPALAPGAQLVYVHGVDGAAAARAAGLRVVARWDRVAITVAAGLPEAVALLRRDPRVGAVERDVAVGLFADKSHVATRADEARTVPRLLDRSGLPFDGSGVTIAINDTGIDATHPMFNEPGATKIVRNLRTACTDAVRCDQMVDVEGRNDPDGHGTALAGIAAGFPRRTPKGFEVRGVAPGAKLVSLGSDGFSSAFGMLNGLNWVLEHHADPCGDGSCPPIRVVANAWGALAVPGGPSLSETATALTDALVLEGVVPVFAFGNIGGDGSQNFGAHVAQNPTPGVIGVANYDDRQAGDRDHAVAPDSSRGLISDPTTYPDLAAPGQLVTAPCPYGGPRCYPIEGDLDYASMSGTSFSSPYIAGVVALALQADPSLRPAEVETLLERTAHPFGAQDYVDDPANPGFATSFDRGHGLVDVTAALADALRRPAPAWRCRTRELVDQTGDAQSLGGADDRALPVAASRPGNDIVRAWIESGRGAEALRFSVEVDDLGVGPPPGSIGETARFTFTFAGAAYDVVLSRVAAASGLETRFHLQTSSNFATRRIVADGLRGTFDPESDVAFADVPLGALARWNPALPPLQPGDALDDLRVYATTRVAPYPVDTSGATYDVAFGACPYVVAPGTDPGRKSD